MHSMRLGVHIPIAGGVLEAVPRATRLACTTMQIFSRSPRGGPAPVLSPEVCERFDAERRAAGIDPLAVHGPYIINLASPDAAMWQQSLRLYQEEYRRAAQLGADYLVTHVGSHRGDGEEAGVARVAEAIARTLDGHRATVMILLENTAGSGQGLGYRFEQLEAIRRAVPDADRVGICLDTAHLFAAGYPIHTPDGLDDTLEAFERTIGFARLKLIHLNDSHVPFDARVDRHWHIGQGHIGREAFRRIVNHPRLAGIPCVLETPKDTEAEDRRNLATVRRLIGASRKPRLAEADLASCGQG
jgi:deoxyribonuclease-4